MTAKQTNFSLKTNAGKLARTPIENDQLELERGQIKMGESQAGDPLARHLIPQLLAENLPRQDQSSSMHAAAWLYLDWLCTHIVVVHYNVSACEG
jgi:hypothetical protein